MTGRTYRTTSGKILTDGDIEALAADVATTEPDIGLLKARRHPGAELEPSPAPVSPSSSSD